MNKTLTCPLVLRGLALAVLAVGTLIVVAPAGAQTRPALVRDVDNGALQPFRTLININLAAGETFKTVNGPVVPAGKRLVIENVSVWAYMANSADNVTGVWLTVPTASPATFALMDPAPGERRVLAGGSAISAYNRLVKLYYNPGETVQGQVFFDGTAGQKIVNIYLNGHLVNL
jgi:hypothetical protein